jgi:hypothetical protein
VAAGAPDRDAVLVQQVQDLFGGVSGELLDVHRGQPDVQVRGAQEPCTSSCSAPPVAVPAGTSKFWQLRRPVWSAK